MNNSRFAPSFYYPTADQTAVPEMSSAAAEVPVAYRENVQQFDEQFTYSQQKAFLDSRQPVGLPVAAATEQKVEPIQEEYREPVMSSYFCGASDIPLCYRKEFINAQAPAKIPKPTAPAPASIQAPPIAPPTQYPAHQFTAPPQYFSSPHATAASHLPAPQSPYHQQAPANYLSVPAAVSPDHFLKNSLPPRTAQATTPAQPANSYAKMYSANPNEVISDYAFDMQEETKGREDEAFKPTETAIVEETEPSAPEPAAVQYKTPASYPETNFNQNVQHGTYNLEVSDYIDFKNDVHPAYGVNKVLAFYSSQTNQPKYEAPATPIHQHKEGEPVKSENQFSSRFQRTIQPAEPLAPLPLANSAYELSEAKDEVAPLGDFRPVALAPSMYQHDNLNDLVSCIDINH